MLKKNHSVARVAVVLVLLLIMVKLNVDLTVFKLQGKLSRDSPKYGDRLSSNVKAQELVDKLRETARLAAGGEDYTFTAAEREAWHKQNPCQSRLEMPAMYAARKHIRDISPNPMWEQVLEEYANLHRICRKRVSNLTDHFLSYANMTVPGCKFQLTEAEYGLGNKLLLTISAVLYAILSQRVMLWPPGKTFSAVLCEPFVGSSWLLSSEADFPMPEPEAINQTWVEAPTFLAGLSHSLRLRKGEKEVQSGGSRDDSGTVPPLVNALVLGEVVRRYNDAGPGFPGNWFFCSTEQRYLSEVPWVYFSGCIYSIPDLFGSAPFGAILQDLFPDRMVSTRLLRSTVLPSDSSWSRFKHLDHVYFQNSERRVAIQLRIFYKSVPKEMSDEMNRRVMDCAISNGIIPNVSDSPTHNPISPSPTASITSVFIASLFPDLKNSLSEFYLRNPTSTGEAVRLVQISSRTKQSYGVEEDREALVEILLLSFADKLLVSPSSTFGQLGQAYGGLTPWIVRSTSGEGPSCERGQTVDPCQQNESLGYDCPNDTPSQQAAASSSPLLQWCLKIDYGQRISSGVQIMDHHLSWQEAQEP